MIFDLNSNKSLNETYKLMAQTIIPRPIAWVVTEDDGIAATTNPLVKIR
jgi:flavin reductase (DIM6/NTAB) family NADH-FMN oxidoreductase RutF